MQQVGSLYKKPQGEQSQLRDLGGISELFSHKTTTIHLCSVAAYFQKYASCFCAAEGKKYVESTG